MEQKNTDKSKKSVRKPKYKCAICGSIVTKRINRSGKPYWVLSQIFPSSPVICNFCIEKSHEIMEDMEEAALWGKDYDYEPVCDSCSCEAKAEESVSVSERVKNLPKLTELIESTKKIIIGQDETVDKVATSLFLNYAEMNPLSKRNVIMVGPSGNGKTKTITTILDLLGVHYVVEDATKYSKVGFVGNNVDDMVRHLYIKCDRNVQETAKGVIVIDEVDKKQQKDSRDDVSGQDVLFSLLKMVEGCDVTLELEESFNKSYVTINTSNITFVVLGVFPDVEKEREKRIRKAKSGKASSIGFAPPPPKDDGKEIVEGFIAEDFEKAGFPKEFVARFDTIAEMGKLSEAMLLKIITDSDASSFKIFRKSMEELKIELVYTDEVIKNIAKRATSLDAGARAINNVVKAFETKIKKQIYSSEKKYSKCILHDDIASNPSSFELI